MTTSIYPGGSGSVSTWIVDPEQQTACARVISKQSGSSGKGGGGSGKNSNLPQKIQDQIKKAKLPQEGEMPFEPRLVKKNGQWEIDKRAPTFGERAGKPGYVDTQGRIWIKDVEIHNEWGQHWDVQIDDGADYRNVSFEGIILDQFR